MSDETRIPLLVLGNSPSPDLTAWASRLGTALQRSNVEAPAQLQSRMDAALAQSDTLLLVGGFENDGLLELTVLAEQLAQCLLMEESDLAVQLIGEHPPAGTILRARDTWVCAVSALAEQQEEALAEIKAHLCPKPPSAQEPWAMPLPTPLAMKASRPPRRRIPPHVRKVLQRARAKPRQADRSLRRTRQTRPARQGSGLPLVMILAAACLALFISGGYLLFYAADSGLQVQRLQEIAALYPEGGSGDDARSPDGKIKTFEALCAANPDAIGWLRIPGADISLPVMLEGTNTYYLTHDARNNVSRYGALFLDSDNEVTRHRQSPNLSIFGHNTKNGSMFGRLEYFRDLEFYRKNAVFSFDTLYHRQQWVVFAVLITNAAAPQDLGRIFEWRSQSSAAPEQIEAFAAQLQKRSIIDTGIEVYPGDKLLSLTTCTYEIKQGRLVVFARALREGEAPPDTAQAKRNDAPLYPEAWYVNYGGQKPQ